MTHLTTRTNFKLATIALAFIASLAFAPLASASHYWQAQLSQPFSTTGGRTNQTSFNLEYKVQSTGNTEIDVKITQNGDTIETRSINNGGDSYIQPVFLDEGDGSYEFKMTATSDHSSTQNDSVTVVLDRSAPAAPDFDGAVRTSDGYRLDYRVFGSDVSQIIFYSSASSSFTANNSTEIARRSVSAGSGSFSYDTSTRRFHAVRVVDSAGNASPLVGDPGVTVRSGSTTGVTSASTASTAQSGSAAGTTDGSTATDTADGTDDGQVPADDQATDSNQATDDSGDVEQAADEATDDDNLWLWIVGILVIIGGLVSYQRWTASRNA